MSADPYDAFAPVYDRWQALHTRPFSAAMILRLQQALDAWGTPERSILDLACGTGTLAHWWQREHPEWEIVGIDRSESMVAHARRSGPGAKAGAPNCPRFQVADMTRFDLGRRFGVVTCFFDSLNHLTRRSDLVHTLSRVRRALLAEGLFLCDLIDEDSFAEIFSSPWVIEGGGLFVAADPSYEVRRGVEFGRIRLSFFDREPPGRSGADPRTARGRSRGEGPADPGDPQAGWTRRDLQILERCWSREEFEPLLDAAGLELLHVQLIEPDEQPEVFVPRRLYVCRPH